MGEPGPHLRTGLPHTNKGATDARRTSARKPHSSTYADMPGPVKPELFSRSRGRSPGGSSTAMRRPADVKALLSESRRTVTLFKPGSC
jgi:hypothetical protein